MAFLQPVKLVKKFGIIGDGDCQVAYRIGKCISQLIATFNTCIVELTVLVYTYQTQ